MVGIIFFIWHSPPSEIKSSPRGNVSCRRTEPVVALRSVEVLSNVLSVVEVGEAANEESEVDSSISDKRALVLGQTLENFRAQHFN